MISENEFRSKLRSVLCTMVYYTMEEGSDYAYRKIDKVLNEFISENKLFKNQKETKTIRTRTYLI